MGRFTVIPQNTFEGLQMDAGVLLNRFNPENPAPPADEDIICATTGGITINCKANYSDLGEDVDNCPNNMKELKHLDSWDCSVQFTSLGTARGGFTLSLGAADIDPVTGAIKPRRNLAQADFKDIWWVGDRADGGFVAVQILNALSTEGFSLKTEKNGKGQLSITITGHVSIDDQDTMPMIFYTMEPAALELVRVAPEAATSVLFGTPVSDMQTGISVSGAGITGTLKYLSEGSLVDTWGAGNFIALKFAGIDAKATSVMVGLDPSQSSGLVEIIDDPDKNGAFKITDKDAQKFKVVSTDGTATVTQVFDLSGLVVETE